MKKFKINGLLWLLLSCITSSLMGCNFNTSSSIKSDDSSTYYEESSEPFQYSETDPLGDLVFDQLDLSNYEATHQKEKVLYSDIRLEQADFSFVASKDRNGQRAKRAHKSNKSQFVNNRILPRKYIEIEQNEEDTLESFFEHAEWLKDLSDKAYNVVDLTIRTCTVLDILIYSLEYDGSYYLLSYDSELDIIHVFANFPCPAIGESFDITLSYNKEGYETIEMTYLRYWNNQLLERVYLLYTPGIQYKFVYGDTFDNGMHVNIADKINNEWHSLSYYYFPNCPEFSHEGYYRQHGPHITFGFEKDDYYCFYIDELTVFKNGDIVAYTEAREDDIPLLDNLSIECDSFYVTSCELGSGLYWQWYISLNSFSNIVEIIPKDYMYAESIKLSNEKTITKQLWSAESGVFNYIDGVGYVDEDGKFYDYNDDKILDIDLCRTAGSGDDYALKFSLHSSDSFSSNLDVVNEILVYLDEMGFEYNDKEKFEASLDVITECVINKTELRNNLFQHFYNIEYNEEHYLNTLYDELEFYNSIEEIHNDYMTNYGLYASFGLPIVKRDPLINLTTNINNISLTSNSFDLSSINFTISPSRILKQGAKYSASLFVGNKRIGNLFNVEEYAGEEMSFQGTSLNINNELIYKSFGSYQLRLCFGLIEERTNQFVPLSDYIKINVDESQGFSFETSFDGTVGGYYVVDVSSNGESIIVNKTFFDTVAPVITSSYQNIDGTKISEEITVQDLINSLNIRDNYDSYILNKNVNVAYNGEEIALEEMVVEGTYTFTVSDASGNIGTLNLYVEIVEPGPVEVGPEEPIVPEE